ncbi:hypothetical protein WJX73_010008 [Symbiochloris irregularis]|uniref:Uncharacterized protein n=1 Tax=Symbiochloris irregularis TaxID=706552 RepID=A0AAW1P8Q0_9CHLO
MFVLAALAVLGSSAVQGRELLQSSPAGDLTPAVPVDVLFAWHGVGTQNYTSSSNSKYTLYGAMADLFKGNTSQLVGLHHFNDQDKPEFFNIDSNGNVLGSVVGSPNRKTTPPRQADDGGFGSVDELLLNAVQATGTMQDVIYIQRLNTLGGVVPTGLFTLPAFNNIPNSLLDVPYQADYIFLVPAGSAPAPSSLAG